MILILLGMLLSPVLPPPMAQPGFTTPMHELQRTHKVTRGFVCFHPMEVRCIDDVCGNTPKSYWRLKVNGDSLHFNANSRILPTDRVEWVYVSEEEK